MIETKNIILNLALSASQESAKHLTLSANIGGGHIILATTYFLAVDNHGELRKCRVN